MPELLQIKTPHWELIVWSKRVEHKRKQLAHTLEARGKAVETSSVRFSSIITLDEVVVEGERQIIPDAASDQLLLPQPLFFENTEYQFEFVFSDNVSAAIEPKTAHKLQGVNDAFRFSTRHGSILQGSINFGNDIGWFRLPLCYTPVDGKPVELSLSFEVLPLKMDAAADLSAIYLAVDKEYPLWRFALAEKTEQTFDRVRKPEQEFPLLWLAQFESLRLELEQGVRLIVNSPHSRLLPVIVHTKADRLKGRVSSKLAERIREDLKGSQYDRKYRIEKKTLSVDTPENRFIKMVLIQCQKKLANFSKAVSHSETQKKSPRLAGAFHDNLKNWEVSLRRLRSQALFHEVGEFHGLSRESLVLQQKPGYSKVYRIWQQLKLYLDVLGNQSSISMKSIDELYEVWCFLEIRLILPKLGFDVVDKRKAVLKAKGVERKLEDGIGPAFEFKRDDGVSIVLAHEPHFKKNTREARVWTVSQKPDIFLKATFPTGESFVWLFDAKYRVEQSRDTDDASDGSTGVDFVPRDAIDQMHRYRDALIHLGDEKQKSRPVYGAYALYPGFFPQNEGNTKDNPYTAAIEEIGIGAFPLLPSQDGAGSAWLASFLNEKLGRKDSPYSQVEVDRHYVEEAARIPYLGMQQRRYQDLTLVVTSAEDERVDGYYEGFQSGSARSFHMQHKASVRKPLSDHVIRETRYCIIAGRDPEGTERKAFWLWPVITVLLVNRKDIKLEDSGKAQPDGASVEAGEAKYWQFELGNPRLLAMPVVGFPSGHHYMKLTKATALDGVTQFDEVEEVYPWVGLKEVT